MIDSLMADKRLDLNAPLLSVRRHPSGPLPPPPSSSSAVSSSSTAAAAAAASSGAEDGRRSRRSSLPFYKSDLRSGPVTNIGAIPFMWEQSPGRAKDGSGGAPAEPVGAPVIAPKPPPGGVPRPLQDEKEEHIKVDAANAVNDSVLRRGPPPISSTSATSAISTSTITTATSSSISSGGSRDVRKANSMPLVEKAPILEEEPSRSDEGDGEEEDAFSDALDRLSRAESSFMNCSVSGMSAAVDSQEFSGRRVSTDPHVRDFMMGRFLPAAQAMAASPSPYKPRKPSAPSHGPGRRVIGNVGEGRRQAALLTYKHGPGHALRYASVHHPLKVPNSDDWQDDDDDEDEYGGASHLSMKGCGFLPRFCLLNPIPVMKVRGRMPLPAARRLLPQVRASYHGSVGDAEDEHTWEEVYRHKLGRVHQSLGEETSKLTSESNQLSYWSDSQTADGSSSYRRSTGEGISPCRNDMSRTPLHDGKGFLGVPNHRNKGSEDDVLKLCDKGSEKCWEIAPPLSSTHTSGSQSPVIEKTVYVDSVEVLEDHDSKLSLSDTTSVMNCMDKDSEIVGESKKIEECLVLKACEDGVTQHQLTEVVDPDELCFAEKSGALGIMGNEEDHALDDQQNSQSKAQGNNDVDALQALLPPPLPKSPSESWLCRTLPSVASKNSAPSFLGFQRYTKKQVVRSSSTDPRRDFETMVKKSMVPKCQMRFADVLARPASED